MKIVTAAGGWPDRLAGLLRKARDRKRPARDVWGIGMVKAPIHRFLDGWPEDAETIWLDDPLGEFHADPFALRIGGRAVVLTEYMPRPGERGEIMARDLADNGSLGAPSAALRLPVHLSYPYLIEQDGVRYCIPESVQANSVLLFRAVGSEPRWIFDCRLIDGFAAADSTVIRHDGRFWLFCTRYTPGRGNPANSELHIWHASELRGRWIPHAHNPVKVDRSNARPAGTPFVHDGELFRPAQDCSRTYGGSIKINRVTALTENAFAEEMVSLIEPRKDGPYPDGFHHLSAFGDYTFIDGKCRVRDHLGKDEDLPPAGSDVELEAALAELA